MIKQANIYKYDIFISYSHDDMDIVEKIVNKLKEFKLDGHKINFWFDKSEIKAGDKFDIKIMQAVNTSKCFIPFFSKSYINKEYCKKEVNHAIDSNKLIIPICLDDLDYKSQNLDMEKIFFKITDSPSMVNYGQGIKDEDIPYVCENILAKMNEVEYDQLKVLIERHNQEAFGLTKFKVEESLFTKIKIEEEYENFSSRNFTSDNKYSLLPYYYMALENNKNLLIFGPGGIGKTVRLKETCKELNDSGIPAIYIPMKTLLKDQTIDVYIKEIVCRRNINAISEMENIENAKNNKVNSMVLILDGINELPLDRIKETMKEIKYKYINSLEGVTLIISSRSDNKESFRFIENDLICLELLPLEKGQIASYIDGLFSSRNLDEALIDILTTPLLLKVYTDTENFLAEDTFNKDIYKKLEFEENPKTPGKLIDNYLKIQILKYFDANSLLEYFIIIEYLLPLIAFKMYTNDSMQIDYDSALDAVYSVKDEGLRYRWYERDKLIKVSEFESNIKFRSLLNIAEKQLSLLNKYSNTKDYEIYYEFTHQVFRDFFVAYHIANELKAINKKKERISEDSLIIENYDFSFDILEDLSDILEEEKCKPRLEDDDWIFPGKNKENSLAPSKYSLLEKSLTLWRNKEGDNPMTAIRNILYTMIIGRDGSLASCDFSNLDLRGCFLLEISFVEWIDNKFYPSNFDGSFINDRSFFLQTNNSIPKSICKIDDSMVAIGYYDGSVIIYDINCSSVFDEIYSNEEDDIVNDLAYNKEKNILVVLFSESILMYDLSEKIVLDQSKYDTSDTYISNIKFDENGHLQFNFSRFPYIWAYSDADVIIYENLDIKEIIDNNFNNFETMSDYEQDIFMIIENPRKKQVAYISPNRQLVIKDYIDGKWINNDSIDEKIIHGAIQITYSDDGEKLLLLSDKFIYLFNDTENFKDYNYIYNSLYTRACFNDNSILLGGLDNFKILSFDLKKISAFIISNRTAIGCVINNYICDHREIKELDDNLRVKSIRKNSGINGYIFDKDSNNITFIANYGIKDMEKIYNFYKDKSYPIDLRKYNNINNIDYLEGITNAVMSISGNNKTFENYYGIYIFKCSFKNIKGSLAERKDLIYSYGGEID